MKKTMGLGRGLDALIDTTHVATAGSSSINEIALSKIYANPDQPRHTFDEEALQELSQSISDHGVISPITLRKDADGKYMIIAGERRYRAAKMAGLTTIPAYVRTAKDEQVMEWALIENIQREDLDAIEIALAYQRLMDEYNLDEDDIETIFDNYGLDYRDRAVVGYVFKDAYDLGYEEAWSFGYIEHNSLMERYFDFEKFGEDLLENEEYMQLSDGRCVTLNY